MRVVVDNSPLGWAATPFSGQLPLPIAATGKLDRLLWIGNSESLKFWNAIPMQMSLSAQRAKRRVRKWRRPKERVAGFPKLFMFLGMVMHDEQTTNDGAATSVAPTLQLSRRGLILSLASMVLAGLGVYAMFPASVGGPPLPVEVELDEQPMVTAGNHSVLVTEIVRVTNLTDHEIPKLSIEINGQYLLFRDSPLGPQEVLELPQRVFTDKRSSQRFNPSKYKVEEIVVTGQLPSLARGVSSFEFETDVSSPTHD